MDNKKGCTLIIESTQRQMIEKAHRKAKELFAHVSPVDSIEGRPWRTFAIIPSHSEEINNDTEAESNDRQSFIDWCDTENEIASSLVILVEKINH